MGVVVWPMIELEADDALASAAHLASKDKKVRKCASGRRIRIWRNACEGPRGADRAAGAKLFAMRPGYAKSSASIRRSFRTCSRSWAMRPTATPASMESGKTAAARLVNKYGPIENFPENALSGERRELALRFKELGEYSRQTSRSLPL